MYLLKDYPRQGTILQLLMERVKQTPDREAFFFRDPQGNTRHWTWKEVADKTFALAAALKSRGLGREDKVLILCENRPEWECFQLGALAAGASVLATEAFAPHARIEEIIKNH